MNRLLWGLQYARIVGHFGTGGPPEAGFCRWVDVAEASSAMLASSADVIMSSWRSPAYIEMCATRCGNCGNRGIGILGLLRSLRKESVELGLISFDFACRGPWHPRMDSVQGLPSCTGHTRLFSKQFPIWSLHVSERRPRARESPNPEPLNSLRTYSTQMIGLEEVGLE